MIMDLKELKRRIESLEAELNDSGMAYLDFLPVNNKPIRIYLSSWLKKSCNKKRVWKSKKFLITLKNVQYGLDPNNMRSLNGRDGVYLIDRKFRPYNEMQRKLFDQYIDKENSGYRETIKHLKWKTSLTKPVRVVSHHMRLLGLFHSGKVRDEILLVDWDETK